MDLESDSSLDDEELNLLRSLRQFKPSTLQKVIQHLITKNASNLNPPKIPSSRNRTNSGRLPDTNPLDEQKLPDDMYEKQDGTLNRGREYEKLMCALYALKLTKNKAVNEFRITSNDNNFGNFGDVCIQIDFENGSNHNFLFQLKHQDKPKPIEQKLFVSKNKKGDYFLEKYFENIPKIKNSTCIIFTNRPVNIEIDIVLIEKFIAKKCEVLEFQDILLESTSLETILEFQALETEQRIYFFAQQKGVQEIEEIIKSLLQDLLACDIYSSFYHYINEWWSGNFKLTKSDFVAKLTELSLSPFLKQIRFSKVNEKTKSLVQAIREFDITIVKNVKNNVINTVWDRFDNDETEVIVKKFVIPDAIDRALWYLGKIPLIVKVTKKNRVIVENAIRLLSIKSVGRKILILGKNLERKNFGPLTVFENLSDLQYSDSYKALIRNQISLQGKSKITLQELIGIDPKFLEIIEVEELIQMTIGDFRVGGFDDNIPGFYLPRTISITIYEQDEILRNFEEDLLIFNCDTNFKENVLEKICSNVVEITRFLDDSSSKHVLTFEMKDVMEILKDIQKSTILVSTETKCTILQFEQICTKTKHQNVYLFENYKPKKWVLQFQKGKTLALNKTRRSINENDIFQAIGSNLNVFCAPPGMGRSTLMKVLSQKSPSTTWALYVDLIKHNSIFSKPDEEILRYFLEIQQTSLLNSFKKIFLENRKINIFLDGLHEVDNAKVNSIIKFARKVSSQGVKVWISLRENLQKMIIEILNVVPIEIKEFNEDEQKIFINERLKEKYQAKEIEKIFEIVFNSAKVNNSQDLLGNPLQLHIITENFYNNRKMYETSKKQNIFDLTQMYKLFFEGKKNAEYNKIGLLKDYNNFENILEHYEVLALKSCLEERDFSKLNVDEHRNNHKSFVEDLKKNGDKFGIIRNTYKNGKAVFTHQTYADYFAAVWFKKNQGKIRSFFDELYTNKFQNLRFMIHVMLAGNNPLLLAFIYKDREKCKCQKLEH